MANLLIAVDAGHGGWDNGASFNGRLEKDDNLRLALAVERELRAQGLNVLMTRDTDVFVTLQNRAKMANEAGADLFLSLHRNSFTEQTSTTNGVENYIYLTAPEASSGRAAALVLDAIVDVGVQRNRGVKRGNYYVLRSTNMPAMLLEMGFIINETDNRLFDEHLEAYAAAITKAIMEYFGLVYQEVPGVTPEPEPGPPPVAPPEGLVGKAQFAVNQRFGINLPVTGVYDDATRREMTRLLQRTLNSDFNAGLAEDGILGPQTLAAFPGVRTGQRGNVVFVIQALLALNGYNPGPLDGIYGSQTAAAIQLFQRDHYLSPDGVTGRLTVARLLRR